MAGKFDPYYTWLGIPPDEQPPDHYRLLGLRRGERNPAAIDHAADQRMVHLRQFQGGKHEQHAQQLLNEVARARLCLLDPAKRAAYDRDVLHLASNRSDSKPHLAPPPPPPAPPPPIAHHTPAPIVVDVHADNHGRHHTPGHGKNHVSSHPSPAGAQPTADLAAAPPPPADRAKWLLWGTGAVCACLLIAIACVLAMRGRTPATPPGETALVFDWPEAERHDVRLFVDGDPRRFPASGPLVVNCRPGKRHVRALRDGFRPYDEEVTVAAGERTTVVPTWKPRPYLVLRWPASERAGARLTINQMNIDLAKAAKFADAETMRFAMEPGFYPVKIMRPGLPAFEQSVEVVEGKDAVVAPVWKTSSGGGDLTQAIGDGPLPNPHDFANLMKQPTPPEVDPAQPPAANPKPDAPKPPPATAELPPLKLPELSAAEREALQALEAAEVRYAAALEPVEQQAAAWRFQAAMTAAEALRLNEPALDAQLAVRRRELAMLAEFKKRIIAKLSAANPRLKKSSIFLRVVGRDGEVVGADDDGILATVEGKDERHTWGELAARCVEQIAQMTAERDKTDDWLAAGLLGLVVKNAAFAEKCFEKAETLGGGVGPHWGPLAAAVLSRADGLCRKGELAKAEETLKALEARATAAVWLAAHQPALVALRTELRAAQIKAVEDAAESLYQEAADRYRHGSWFELKPLVEKLRRQYADSRAAATPRKPTLDEMEKITGRLGRALTVRLDGKGGYRTIQSAIEAAPPYSVIEIQDNGPYYETIHVRPETPGVTIRGRKDCFPVVMTGGPRGKADKVAELDADRTTVERMAFIVGASTGRKEGDQPLWVRRRSQLYSVIAGQAVGTSRTDRATNVWITANSTIENCVLGPLSDAVTIETPVAIRDTVFVQQPLVFQKSGRAQLENVMARTILVKNGPCSAINCTVSEDIEFYGPDSVLEHSIVRSASANQACRIERSNVFGRYLNEAQAGEGCLSIEPGFVNLAEFDLRLGPKSACRGKAADGGDLGARLSAETLEVLRVAAELRKRGVIRF